MNFTLWHKRFSLSPITLIASMIAGPTVADGLFFQQDVSKETFVTTLSVQRDRMTFGMNAVAIDEDQSLALNITQSVDWSPENGTLRIGPAVRLILQDGAFDTTEVGVKVNHEKYVPTNFGAFLWLVDASTIDKSLLLLGQFSLAKQNMSFELAFGRSEDFLDTSITLSRTFGDSRFSGRIGYRFVAEDLFLGISYNTF